MEKIYQNKGDTWPKILRYNYEKYGDRRKAMRHKHFGVWQPHTWKDYYLNVKYLSLGLLSFGFEARDKVLIIGDNAPEWYYAELAAQAIHGLSVGAFSELLPAEIKAIAENCDVRFAIVEGQEQVDKLLQVKSDLPLLQKVVYWKYKGLPHYAVDILIGYREVLKRGERYETENPGIFEKHVETGGADDACAIVHTAGTTGDVPKAAVHTFRTLMAGADFFLKRDPWFENDNVIPYLPPVWINEQWLGIGCHLLSGGILNFAEAPETQQRDSRETRPSIVFYGARFWESQASMVQSRILGADAIKRFVFHRLMPIGYRVAELKYRRQKPGLPLRFLYMLATIFLFRSIKNSLGLSNARICYTTGAMLSPEAFRFYHALNLPLKSIYGTTEGGALAGAANNDEIHFETTGPVQKEAEVTVKENGEILYRQPGAFIGYYQKGDLVDDVRQDGWFHSDDFGFIREDGHLVFVERIKSLRILSGSDRLAPQLIESRLRFSPYIEDAWILTGPNDAFVSAVIVIHYLNVSRWAGQKKLIFTSFSELSQAPEVYDLVMQAIESVNQTLPRGCRVMKYVNLRKEFDPDEGELTRTRNLRRLFLEKRYRELIDAIYAGEDEGAVQTRIKYRDGRIGTSGTTLAIRAVRAQA
ncbi:MAG: AMP-binding protein [Desulfobacteraceae bacterium]